MKLGSYMRSNSLKWYLRYHPIQLFRDIGREIKYACQRAVYGYDTLATYGVDSHLAEQIPKLMRELIQWGKSYPVSDQLESHALSMESKPDEDLDHSDKSLKHWHEILEEIAVGFETAQAIMNEEGFDGWDELHNEWDRRFPGVDPHYDELVIDEEVGECYEMKTREEYYALVKELDFWNRREIWRKEQLKKFHRGMILFHANFFNLWD